MILECFHHNIKTPHFLIHSSKKSFAVLVCEFLHHPPSFEVASLFPQLSPLPSLLPKKVEETLLAMN